MRFQRVLQELSEEHHKEFMAVPVTCFRSLRIALSDDDRKRLRGVHNGVPELASRISHMRVSGVSATGFQSYVRHASEYCPLRVSGKGAGYSREVAKFRIKFLRFFARENVEIGGA